MLFFSRQVGLDNERSKYLICNMMRCTCRDWEKISDMLQVYGTFLLVANVILGIYPFVMDALSLGEW